MSADAARIAELAATVRRGRVARSRRRRVVVGVLAALVLAGFLVAVHLGQTVVSPATVLRVVSGEDVPGASFTIGRIRLPRASLAVLAGLSFGMAGVAFQTMLRNPLASPDIIGVSSGAGAAAAFAIIVLGLGSAGVSAFAIAAGLLVALAITALSFRHGVAGTRFILVGIGVAAMLDAATSYLLSRAAEWDLQEAMRWLTGSLNGSSWSQAVPVAIALAVFAPILLATSRDLGATQMGDDAAAALGVRVSVTRVVVIVAAVGLISFATAATGPIAFVAFLAGPIAARLVGPGGSLLVPAALVGALLVVVGDLAGQFLLGTRYPVGVVTGVLGAPYLIWLIVRTNRQGGGI